MKVALGSDHRGDVVTADLKQHLLSLGHEPIVVGTCSGQICDYPDEAYLVAKKVSDGEADRGILACGSGIGMAIAANKVDGIRAALVFDEVAAGRSRRHNDANVLCLSPEMNPIEQIRKIVEIWLKEAFEGGRHARRVAKIAAIERGENPADVVDQTETADAGAG